MTFNAQIFDFPNTLVDPAGQAVGNVADIRSRRATSIAEVAVVDTARVVLAKSRVNGLAAPLVAVGLEVTLEVLCALADHGGDGILLFVSGDSWSLPKLAYLAEIMLARVACVSTALHQSASGDVITWGVGGLNADIAVALLHDDGENHALVDADLGALLDGVPDAADIFAAVTSSCHGRLVAVEHVLELDPFVNGREVLPWAGVPVGSHFLKIGVEIGS